MKKTMEYLKGLTDEELKKLMQPISILDKTGILPEHGKDELIDLAQMIKEEIGMYDVTGATAKAVKDEICRRFTVDESDKKKEIKPGHEPGKYEPGAVTDPADGDKVEFFEFWTINPGEGIIFFGTSKIGIVAKFRVLGICCETQKEAGQVWERMKLKQKIIDRIEDLNKNEEAVDWGKSSQPKYYFTCEYKPKNQKVLIFSANDYQPLPFSYYSALKPVMQKVQKEFGDEAIINAFQLNS